MKVGGVAADIIVQRFRSWSAAQDTSNPSLFAPEQWPREIRRQVDELADHLRLQAAIPPVIHYSEWMDLWSMGDTFPRWLTPPSDEQKTADSFCPTLGPLNGPNLYGIHASRFEAYAYSLPDGGRLGQFLACVGPQQFRETDLLIWQIREAVAAWDKLVERAVIVLLRKVVDVSATDDEIENSLTQAPKWLVEETRSHGQASNPFDWTKE